MSQYRPSGIPDEIWNITENNERVYLASFKTYSDFIWYYTPSQIRLHLRFWKAHAPEFVTLLEKIGLLKE